MDGSIGPLVAADEGFCHQIADTFAIVGQSDLSWTEKVWTSVFSPDGSIQIDAGLGKYPNRNVMDGFAGVSRGREQFTVRVSRELSQDPEATDVGPLHYAVTKPLEAVRFALDPNEGAAIAFDLEMTALTPPYFEDRDRRWDRMGMRVVSDLLRYHQPVRASGWVEVEGDRKDVSWVGFRDHSWGVRRDVGAAPSDIRQPSRALADTDYLMHWAPFALQTPEGEWYELQYYLQETSRAQIYRSGHLNLADGSQVKAWRVTPDVRFDPDTRRFLEDRAHSEDAGVFARLTDFGNYVLGDTYSEANEGLKGRVVAEIAAERGQDPFDTLVEIVVNDELRTVLWPIPTDGDDESWRMRAELWSDGRAMIGGSDAGAHLDRMCGSSYTTRFIGDCIRGRKLATMERAVEMLTKDPAELFGLRDRGTLAEGNHADVVVFDPETIGAGHATLVHDLPGETPRLIADATGIVRVLVNGVETVRDNEATGAIPGTLLRAGVDTTTVSTRP